MEKVTVYKLSNGDLIEDRDIATRKQHNLDIISDITGLLHDNHYSFNDIDLITKFILKNQDAINAILNSDKTVE